LISLEKVTTAQWAHSQDKLMELLCILDVMDAITSELTEFCVATVNNGSGQSICMHKIFPNVTWLLEWNPVQICKVSVYIYTYNARNARRCMVEVQPSWAFKHIVISK
jgi:hypothetical protein